MEIDRKIPYVSNKCTSLISESITLHTANFTGFSVKIYIFGKFAQLHEG